METFPDGDRFMENFGCTKQWDKLMLIKDAGGLGLCLPNNFDIDRCVDLVGKLRKGKYCEQNGLEVQSNALGKDTTIITVDVYAQKNYQMTMERFAEKWKAADRPRPYNI